MSTSHSSLALMRSARPFSSCRQINNYEKINKIEEGTYGLVYRARDRQTGQIVALKKLKLERERDGFPVTSLREINALLYLRPHPNIVNIREIVVGRELNSVYIVMDFIDHDIRTILDDYGPFSVSETKTIISQLLSALVAIHGQWMVHRDLKTSNLLLTNDGQLKVADFGLTRKLGSPMRPEDPLTKMVVTLWYRAPELLLGASHYDEAIDMWSVGCIMAELLAGKPLFPGISEIDQIHRIFSCLGMPTDRTWPDFYSLPHAAKIAPIKSGSLSSRLIKILPMLSAAGIDLMNRFLTCNPKRRISAADALQHPFLMEEPLPKDSTHFPSWPSRNFRDNKRPKWPNTKSDLNRNNNREL